MNIERIIKEIEILYEEYPDEYYELISELEEKFDFVIVTDTDDIEKLKDE